MTADVPLVERLAEVMAGHEDFGLYAEHGGDTHCVCSCDKVKRPGTHRAHVARALLPVVEQAVLEARGEAWDEGWKARDDYHRLLNRTDRNPYRADAIATTEETP